MKSRLCVNGCELKIEGRMSDECDCRLTVDRRTARAASGIYLMTLRYTYSSWALGVVGPWACRYLCIMSYASIGLFSKMGRGKRRKRRKRARREKGRSQKRREKKDLFAAALLLLPALWQRRSSVWQPCRCFLQICSD